MSEPLSHYMTLRQVAAYLGVKPSTITAYISRGQLGFPPPDAMVEDRKLWKRSTIEQWEAQRPYKGRRTDT